MFRVKCNWAITFTAYMNYTLEDLLDDKNAALYESLGARVNIILNDSDEDSWTSKLSENVAYIGVLESAYPTACFSHELLHMKLELYGMGHPYFIDNENLEESAAELVSFLYNQLAHHKMYPEFVEMGYPPEQFLYDSDRRDLRKQLKRDVPQLERRYRRQNGKLQGGMAVLLPYLTLRSPNDADRPMPSIGQRLVQIADPCLLSGVDRVLETWVKAPILDCCLSLARLFKLAGRPRFGFSLTESQGDMIVAGNVEIG